MIALSLLLALIVILIVLSRTGKLEFVSPAPFVVFFVGAIGGFVGLQRRINQLSDEDLKLIAESVIYSCLAPAVERCAGDSGLCHLPFRTSRR